MGKILLISRKRILNQALSLHLFPDHDVHVRSSLNEVEPKEVQGYDLLMVDPSFNSEGQSVSAATRAIQKIKAPVLWLVEEGSIPPPKREGLVSLQVPVKREALEKALDDLLSSHKPEEAKSSSQGRGDTGGRSPKRRGGGKDAKAPVEEAQFIELVDIVEEETETTGKEAPPK